MSPAEQVAAALASTGKISLRDLQIALEWQRESEATVLDVLVYLGLTDGHAIREAANSLAHVPELSINHDIEARQEVDRRRQFKRVELPESVEVSVAGTPVGGERELLNLSLGGIGYGTSGEPPAENDRVPVTVRSAGGGQVDTRARVCYRRQVGDRFTVGLELDALTPAGVMVLSSILQELDHTD